ncbi:MAG: GFA family protein [Myxococcales bacterium]|nr:GFA family protein [Myxococcales bacterium]
MTPSDRWVAGGCHCGAVRFRVQVPRWTAVACNCSICTKKGFLHLFVGADGLQVEQGRDTLTEYRFGSGTAQHWFCPTCGVHPFYVPRSHPDGFSVNVNALDDALVRERFTIEPFDGRNWEANIAGLRDPQ